MDELDSLEFYATRLLYRNKADVSEMDAAEKMPWDDKEFNEEECE